MFFGFKMEENLISEIHNKKINKKDTKFDDPGERYTITSF